MSISNTDLLRVLIMAMTAGTQALQKALNEQPDPPHPGPMLRPVPKGDDDEPPIAVASTFNRWTEEEERRLCAEFDQGKTTAELAKLHNRSRAAIEARLLKLGKIDVSALTVQLRYMPQRPASR